ncbi:MAG TPA: CinA family nicotinamide mononucleotide deamidase-related protein [Bacteroidales bacterium]|nr:CinA family nicotinamide mononucleotide deamidase-related protein [Bacteroidales bacterium]HRZ48844.1 CinA family nicotinamide mononucleotide deamidase-related protein [Bacteroidales bacterium]
MRCEILNIGEELLNGTSVNTNATWLCGRFAHLGARIVAVTMVGDGLNDILAAFHAAAQRADFVVVTGGLGPTSDDRTKEATLRYFGGSLVPVESEIERIRRLFADRGLPLTERNIEQGYVPDTCTPITNPVGTAPGMEFKSEGRIWLFLPGVPAEMKALVDQNIHRWFTDAESGKTFVADEIMVIGVGESFVADRIAPWQAQLPAHLALAYLPSAGLVRIRLSCFSEDAGHDRLLIRSELQKVLAIFPGEAFYTAMEEWNHHFYRVLHQQNISLSVAESCTGGYLAHRITSVPGSSSIFRGGVVAYHNDIKTELLGVPATTLERHGAVSRETVEQMAFAVRSRFRTHMGVAISGVAGPDGGTPEKPVGTVWIAVADNLGVEKAMFLMGTDRIRNIEKSAVMAMKMVLNRLATAR